MSWLAETERVSTNAFRKPREMEYEKASHGGLDCCFPWGESVPASIKAVYSPDRAIGVTEGEACGYGLHSPTANVFCWTEDWMGPYPNTLAALVNPRGPPTGKKKILRGGTWWIYNLSFRCADRWEAFPDLADDHIGFRVVHDLPVPADMPVWTGRPPLAPRTATRFASLAAANTSSNFCIEEAYRALQARAQMVGFTLTWPAASAGPADAYPPNGFYCADLSNDPVPGTFATNLVQALFNQLSTGGLLDNFVTNQSTELFRYSTNSLPSITKLDPTNYLAPFHDLAEFIPELKTIPVTLPGVGITSVSGGPLTNMESRLSIITSPFFPNCDALTNAVTHLWLSTNWTYFGANAIGVHANILVDQPTLTPPTNTGQWRGNMSTRRGKLGRDLAAYPAGNWPVYASVSGTNAPNVPPFPVDGQFHSLGENALGGQIWVSSAKFADVGDTPPVFVCIPAPTNVVVRFPSFTGWDLGGVAAITFSFTNEVTGECQGCKATTIVFTDPATLTNNWTVGSTNHIDVAVTRGNVAVVDGQVKFELVPSSPVLGVFSNNVTTLNLDAEGKVHTYFLAQNGGVADIKATGQNLKDPSDHTTALDNVSTNITVNILTTKLGAKKVVHNVGGAELTDAEKKDPGAFVPLNNDDDDYSSTAASFGWDFEQTTNPVVGEDDMLPIVLHKIDPVASGGNYTLTIPGNVKVWKNKEKGTANAVTGSTTFNATTDTTLYVEGVESGSDDLKLNWSDGTTTLNACDSIKVNVFFWLGPLNVPGYSKHQYAAAQSRVLPGSKWVAPVGGALSTGGTGQSDVRILWGEGPTVGKAVYQVNANFVWDLQVNVVRVQILPPGPDQPKIVYEPNKPFQFPGEPRLIESSVGNGIAADVSVGQITGPEVNGKIRGVKFMEMGFIQTFLQTTRHAEYNDTNPKFIRRSTFVNGTKYIDYITEQGFRSAAPWMDKQNFSNRYNSGFFSYINFTADPAVPIPGARFRVTDSPSSNGTDQLIIQADAVDLFNIVSDFNLHFCVRTKQAVSNAESQYTVRLQADWKFDGSGDIKSKKPGEFKYKADAKSGCTGPKNFAVKVDGNTPAVISDPPINDLLEHDLEPDHWETK